MKYAYNVWDLFYFSCHAHEGLKPNILEEWALLNYNSHMRPEHRYSVSFEQQSHRYATLIKIVCTYIWIVCSEIDVLTLNSCVTLYTGPHIPSHSQHLTAAMVAFLQQEPAFHLSRLLHP